MKVLIAGAGIGGLSAAIAIKNEGHEVKCFDRVREMRPIGAAISGVCPSCPSSRCRVDREHHTDSDVLSIVRLLHSHYRCICTLSLVKWCQSSSIIRTGSYAILRSNGPNVILEA